MNIIIMILLISFLVMVHEFGHFYDSLLGFPEENDRLYELEAANAPMSEHAKSSSLEYFAEFFAYWCSGNTRTLALLKELASFTRELGGGASPGVTVRFDDDAADAAK